MERPLRAIFSLTVPLLNNLWNIAKSLFEVPDDLKKKYFMIESLRFNNDDIKIDKIFKLSFNDCTIILINQAVYEGNIAVAKTILNDNKH